MNVRKNTLLQGQHGKPILVDSFHQANDVAQPLVIFSHGFKGFKDFGLFNHAAERFAEAGITFVKFNFSHNGTTVDRPEHFDDLEAFSDNNFSIELDDLRTVISHVAEGGLELPEGSVDLNRIWLVGHSRGGAISILGAREDPHVKGLVTWAAVNVFGRFWSAETMAKWKEEGILIVPNGRTGQQMPMKYQVFEDYEANRKRLYIPDAVRQLQMPFLVIHGDADPTVKVEMAREMKEWNPAVELKIIEGANHVFGGKHPWTEPELPAHAIDCFDSSIRFILENS